MCALHRRLVERLSAEDARANLAACLRAAQPNRCRTTPTIAPLGAGDDGAVSYELDMIRRSAANMKKLGLM